MLSIIKDFTVSLLSINVIKLNITCNISIGVLGDIIRILKLSTKLLHRPGSSASNLVHNDKKTALNNSFCRGVCE